MGVGSDSRAWFQGVGLQGFRGSLSIPIVTIVGRTKVFQIKRERMHT